MMSLPFPSERSEPSCGVPRDGRSVRGSVRAEEASPAVMRFSLPKFLNTLILSQDDADEPPEIDHFFRNLGGLGGMFREFWRFCIYRSIASIHFF